MAADTSQPGTRAVPVPGTTAGERAAVSGRSAAQRIRLVQYRKALGLTQERLAELLGIDRSTVARWERGATAPAPWLRPRLARALRVPTHQLTEMLEHRDPVRPGGAASRGGPVTQAPAPATDRSVVPRQLPAIAGDFAGRTAELAALTGILDANGGAPGSIAIAAIGGMAGVGKTALALHWAHQVADRFPDGQLYVNLRGFAPSGSPAVPAEVIRGFLDALGVPPERLSPHQDVQAGLYRSLLADKRMLIVLDNARDEQQIRPLLPASPGSLVVVTSRNQLAGLATDGARLLALGVLSPAAAVRLLTARVDPPRADAEPAAIAEIAALCACLPLALAVAAARAAARPDFPLSALADDFRSAVGRLDALDALDPTASVRFVFSWSYEQLSPAAAGMFRLLGLHPGPDVSVPAAAALAAVDQPSARRLLRDLARAHLIAEHAPGRYAFHDLLRDYAAVEARSAEGEQERRAAVCRLLDHYLQAGRYAAHVLRPNVSVAGDGPPDPGAAPEITDPVRAMTWFEAEHQVLLAATGLAAAGGFDRHACLLPQTMVPFQQRLGLYHELAATQRTALAAATRLRDLMGQVVASGHLASVFNRINEHDQAIAHATNLLGLCRRAGSRIGEASALGILAKAAQHQRRWDDALRHAEQAMRIFFALDSAAGEALSLGIMGWTYCLLGDYRRGRSLCRRALAILADGGCGDSSFEQGIWHSLGYAEERLANFAAAFACYELALRRCRESDGPHSVAMVLTDLGSARQAAGDFARASEAWREALAILDSVGHPAASEVRAKLASAPTAEQQSHIRFSWPAWSGDAIADS